MKIVKIETAKVSIPLVTPFKTALRTVDSVNDIVVRVTTDDGNTGFGEAPPTAVITGDTQGSILSAIQEFIAPALIGMEIENLDGIMKKLHGCILKNSSAKAAVDVERIQAIRKAVGPDIKLRIDANQGWSAKEAVRIIRTLEDMGIDMDLVEQPVNAHDFEGMKFVTSQVYTPILADESVFSPEDAIRIIGERAADLINIKLMKTGGIYEALKICSIAESFGIECMIGCMLESKISVSAAAHLAAGKGIITRADLDGPSLCREDPYTGGPVFDGPKIFMNEDPGLGISKVPAFGDCWNKIK